MPEEAGAPPFITFRSEVASAIGDFRRAIIRQGGKATRELEVLRSILHPWGKDDEEYLEAVAELETEMLKAQRRISWARPTRPWWQTRYFSLLLDLAKRHNLLDIEAIIHLDEEEL